MLANIENSMFVSWDELKAGNVDLSKCKVIWWHWQNQPSETIGDFESAATSTAMGAINILTDYYNNGGAFILSRAAVQSPGGWIAFPHECVARGLALPPHQNTHQIVPA